MKVIIKPALKPQLFATSWLGLFETPITADKRLRYASPKFLPSATSFIHKTLGEMFTTGQNIKTMNTLKKGGDKSWKTWL